MLNVKGQHTNQAKVNNYIIRSLVALKPKLAKIAKQQTGLQAAIGF